MLRSPSAGETSYKMDNTAAPIWASYRSVAVEDPQVGTDGDSRRSSSGAGLSSTSFDSVWQMPVILPFDGLV